MKRLGFDTVWNTFSNVCHHIHMSNLVWKHLHWSVSSVFRSESRMISNDWYTSLLRSLGILDYDRLASSQKRKCLVILTTILLFSIIPCFVYHSLLTKAKSEAVKSQTSKNTRSFKQIKMNLNQTTKNGKASIWRLDWARRMSVMESWWSERGGTGNFRRAGNTILIPTKPHTIINHICSKDNLWL